MLEAYSHIDLNRQTLYGWEGTKDEGNIAEMVEALRAGIGFLPVPVMKRGDGVYELDWRVVDPTNPALRDGGHRRALAYLRTGILLPCKISPNPVLPFAEQERVAIKDILVF